MPEARLSRPARRVFDELSPEDQAQVMGLVHYLELDPQPDGRRKVPLNPRDEALFLLVFDDGVWRVLYHLTPEDSLINYGITKYARPDP